MSPNKLLETLDTIEDGGGAVGGQGYFCKGKIEFGYKVFAQGVDPAASFFLFDPFAPKTAEVALAKAKAFATEHQVTSSPAKSIALTLLRATVKGRDVTWANDLQKIVARWMPAYEKVWLPALEKLAIDKPGEYWMHVALVNDPSGRTEKMKNRETGQEMDVPSKVWVPDQLFPTEVICQKAGEDAAKNAPVSAGAPAVAGDVPPGFNAQIWAQYKPDIIKELGGKTEAELASVSKNWNIPVEFLQTL